MLPLDSLLTAQEIADYMRIKLKTIQNWAALGILPCLRVNNRVLRFWRGDVDKWFAQYEHKGRKRYKSTPEILA